jgi:hypothetical protein
MADHERRARHVDLAVEDVQVGPADPAGMDLDQELPRSGFGVRDRVEPQRLAGLVEDHRAHR